MEQEIDARKIMEALCFYEKLGYYPIKVPFVVSVESSKETSPPHKKDFSHGSGVYVASAEQSFIEILETLPAGKYSAITPCYRDEEVLDSLHLNIFLKLELIVVGASCMEMVMRDARKFFRKYTDFVEVRGGDLEIGGIEVGSYGERSSKGIIYTYGTGIAEPRLSSALHLKNK